MQKRYLVWIVVVLLLLVLIGCGTTVGEKFQKFLPGKEVKLSQLNLQIGSVYSQLPTTEFVTQVWAWDELPECRLNANSEINSIKNLYLQGKNTEWLEQLGVWQDKLLCMDTDTLLQVDTVLAKALQELAGIVRSTSSIEAEFTGCNSFNALLQPSWQLMDLTMHTGKSPLYQELQAAADVGKKCNFYYPKVTFPLVAWNWETDGFDLFGLICEQNKENPSCWAAHDFFWTFALKPVNYGVGCTLSEWADTGFICAKGVTFNSPGRLEEWKLKDDVLKNEDVTSSYVSKLGITGAEIVKNVENICGLTAGSPGTIRPGLETGISKESILSNLGKKLGLGTSSSTGSKPAGFPSGPSGFQPTTGLEERLSAIILPLLPCAEGSSGQGWEELGNAMKGGCSVMTGKGSDKFNEAEDKIAAASGAIYGGNACLSKFQRLPMDQSPPIIFSQRLTQHGITPSGCGEGEGTMEPRDTGEEPRPTPTPTTPQPAPKPPKPKSEDAAIEECGKTSGCGENIKAQLGITSWGTATPEQKEAFKRAVKGKITIHVVADSSIRDTCNKRPACAKGSEIYISESLANTDPNAPAPNVAGKPGGPGICDARMTAKGVLRHEIDHALDNRNEGDEESDVRYHDSQADVWDYQSGNEGTPADATDDGSLTSKCTADYKALPYPNPLDDDNSRCSGAFDSALNSCIFGTGPLPLTTFSEQSWCKWAICDEWSQEASGGGAGGPDIGGIAPSAKGPGYGLGGDTRDFDQYDGTDILCGETLLEMFGMIDCELSDQGQAASGGSSSNAGFCQRGTPVDQGETVQQQEPVEDSRCGLVAVEFECAGTSLGTVKLLKSSTAQLLKITKGTIIK